MLLAMAKANIPAGESSCGGEPLSSQIRLTFIPESHPVVIFTNAPWRDLQEQYIHIIRHVLWMRSPSECTGNSRMGRHVRIGGAAEMPAEHIP